MNKIVTNAFMTLMITFMLWSGNKAIAQCSTNTAQQGNNMYTYSYLDPLSGYWVNGQCAVTLTPQCAPSAEVQVMTRRKQFGAPWVVLPVSGILTPWSPTQTAAMTVAQPTIFDPGTVISVAGYNPAELYEFMFVYASSSCSSSVATLKMVANTPLAIHQLDLSYESDYLWLKYQIDNAYDITKYDVMYTDANGIKENIARKSIDLQEMQGKARLPVGIKKNGQYQVIAYGVDNKAMYSNTININRLPDYYLELQQAGNTFTCVGASGFYLYDLSGRLLIHSKGERLVVEGLQTGNYFVVPIHPAITKGEQRFIQ